MRCLWLCVSLIPSVHALVCEDDSWCKRLSAAVKARSDLILAGISPEGNELKDLEELFRKEATDGSVNRVALLSHALHNDLDSVLRHPTLDLSESSWASFSSLPKDKRYLRVASVLGMMYKALMSISSAALRHDEDVRRYWFCGLMSEVIAVWDGRSINLETWDKTVTYLDEHSSDIGGEIRFLKSMVKDSLVGTSFLVTQILGFSLFSSQELRHSAYNLLGYFGMRPARENQEGSSMCSLFTGISESHTFALEVVGNRYVHQERQLLKYIDAPLRGSLPRVPGRSLFNGALVPYVRASDSRPPPVTSESNLPQESSRLESLRSIFFCQRRSPLKSESEIRLVEYLLEPIRGSETWGKAVQVTARKMADSMASLAKKMELATVLKYPLLQEHIKGIKISTFLRVKESPEHTIMARILENRFVQYMVFSAAYILAEDSFKYFFFVHDTAEDHLRTVESGIFISYLHRFEALVSSYTGKEFDIPDVFQLLQIFLSRLHRSGASEVSFNSLQRQMGEAEFMSVVAFMSAALTEESVCNFLESIRNSRTSLSRSLVGLPRVPIGTSEVRRYVQSTVLVLIGMKEQVYSNVAETFSRLYLALSIHSSHSERNDLHRHLYSLKTLARVSMDEMLWVRLQCWAYLTVLPMIAEEPVAELIGRHLVDDEDDNALSLTSIAAPLNLPSLDKFFRFPPEYLEAARASFTEKARAPSASTIAAEIEALVRKFEDLTADADTDVDLDPSKPVSDLADESWDVYIEKPPRPPPPTTSVLQGLLGVVRNRLRWSRGEEERA